MESAWGVDHGEVSKGFGAQASKLARKLPGGEYRHAKKQLQHQLIKPVEPAPTGDFMKPRPNTPRGPLPSLHGPSGPPPKVPKVEMPSKAGKRSAPEAGWRPSNRRMT